MRPPRLKICGLTRRQDVEAANRAGAHYVGVVMTPASPRFVASEAAAELLDGSQARRVGVFVDAPPAAVAAAASVAGLHVLQLHGDETVEEVAALRLLGRWQIWKAIRVREAGDVLSALETYGSVVHGLLLDAWSPTAYGGTGRRFPWADVAGVRAQLPPRIELVIAGGLREENLRDAVAQLRPDTVDISSGVETAPGVKNAAAIEAVTRILQRIP